MRSVSTEGKAGVRPRGKRTAVAAGLLTLLVAGALGVALRSTVQEWWLVRRLESGEPDEITIKTLKEIGSVRAIPRLLEIALSEHDLAPAADQSLRDVIARAGRSAAWPLLDGLESPRPSVRALALRLLRRSGSESPLVAERAVQALNDPEDEVKEAAVEAVKRLGLTAVPSLSRALEKHSFELNSDVQSALSHLGQDAWLLAPVLVGRFEVESNQSQVNIIDALGSVGQKSLAVARLLAQALANEDKVIADRASHALYQRFPVGRHAVQVLRDVLTITTAKTRHRAIETIRSLYEDGRSAAPDLVTRVRDQDPEVREAAARALGYVGANGDEVVAALTETLHDSVDDVRSSALLAFLNLHETIPIPVSEIEARLCDSSASVRRMAARLILQACGADPLVLPACIEGLGNGTDYSRLEAVKMIAGMGPVARDAAPYLAGHVHDPNVSLEVLKSLLALGPGAAAAAPALLEALDTENAERFRLSSEALVSAAPDSVQFLEILREALGGPVPSLRPSAAAALWRLGQDRVEAMEVLTSRLQDIHGVNSAVAGFVSLGREMVPRLLAAILDPASPPRAAAAVALGRLGVAEPSVIEALGLLARDPSREEADSALEALIRLGADPTGPLLQALQSSDRARRSVALQQIEEHGLTSLDFKRPLEKLLSDEDPGIRTSAAMILLRIDPVHEGAARVTTAVVEEGRFGRRPHGQYSRELTDLASTSPAAVEALLAFYRRADDSPLDGYRLQPTSDGRAPFVAPLTAALARKDEPTRYVAACLLRDSGPVGAPAVPALVACLEDGSARVRVRAALTLGAIGPAAAPLATAALTRQLGRRQDPLMRASVLGSLGDLGEGARDALPVLLAIVGDAAEEATLRCLALEAAVCVGGESAIEPELRPLVDRGPGVLRRYAELLRVGLDVGAGVGE
ncbi:MAG TPA: HEAT repeat domain-containing protein [Planctomycetota bacterium]|nr:HEAT repeat domain-containing protein [Planctomycetota bacterium]